VTSRGALKGRRAGLTAINLLQCRKTLRVECDPTAAQLKRPLIVLQLEKIKLIQVLKNIS